MIKKNAIKKLWQEIGVVGVREVRDDLLQVSYSPSVASPTKYFEWDGQKMERTYL
jgi:hypothetical protein